MLRTILSAATAATVLAAAPAANAAVHHHDWAHMTLDSRITVQRRLIVNDWRIITRWRAAQVRVLAETRPVPKKWSAVSVILPDEPYAIHWHYLQMKWVQRELRESLHERALQQARASPPAPAGFPPHHALWMCLSTHGEGGPTSVNPNGHYGMLQMTYDWFGLIDGRASDHPQAVQEWAAETAYKANHYSRSFLDGQWLNYDHEYECLAYA